MCSVFIYMVDPVLLEVVRKRNVNYKHHVYEKISGNSFLKKKEKENSILTQRNATFFKLLRFFKIIDIHVLYLVKLFL